MRLTKVIIKGYRSFKAETAIHLDDNITVLLGANDHGKTNFLSALLHLNEDQLFDRDLDLNWDEEGSGEDQIPVIRYSLKPDSVEREAISVALIKKERLNRAEERIATLMEKVTSLEDQMAAQEEELGTHPSSDDEGEDGPESCAEKNESDDEDQNEDSAAREKLSVLEAEHSRLEVTHERWSIAKEVILRVEGNEVSSERVEAALAEIKRRLSHLQGELRKTLEKKNSAAKALSKAKEEGSGVSHAEKSFKDIVDAVTRIDRAITECERGVSRLEMHLEFMKTNLDSEYQGYLEELIAIRPQCPDTLEIQRKGRDGKLEWVFNSEAISPPDFLRERLPQVRLFPSVDRLLDEVSNQTINQPENAFMRGIFYYAKLGPETWNEIFTQTDRTSKQLQDASTLLNKVLRRDWRQGRELEFKLQHSQAGKKINLVIHDPKVEHRYVRVSRRSSGFTHFFGLKTMLHAYEKESRASKYIWLFDEPGISLHPDGQHDLLQALDTISKQNQVVYTTHSLFMIDKNYPTRHRLLAKANEGTRVDGKPFIGNWKSAIDALGLALPGTILFASHVLLVEGASDVIFLNAILQRMAKMDLHNMDINPLSIIPTGDIKEADAIVRILKEAAIKPTFAALYDGDGGGAERKKKLKSHIEQNDAHVVLAPNKTLEDYLPYFDDLFVPVTIEYVARTLGVKDDKRRELEKAVAQAVKEPAEETKCIDRILKAIEETVGDQPSKVGIARDYANALLEADLKGEQDWGALKKLIDSLQKALGLPDRTTGQEKILQGG